MDNKYKKIRNIFYHFVNASMLIVFVLIVYYTVADMAGPYLPSDRGDLFGNKLWVLRSYIILFIFFCVLYAVAQLPFLSWTKTVERIIVFLYLGICIFSSWYFANDGLYEIAVVNDAAQALSSGIELDITTLEFLAKFNYIYAITCYASVWYFIGGKVVASLVICIGMTLGLWVSLQIIKHVKGNNASLWMCSGLFYISIPIFLSCSVIYNYTAVFWMPVTMIYLYMLFQNEQKSNKKILFLVLISVISSIGVSIFSIVVVPLIAIIIDLFLHHKKEAFIMIIVVMIGTSMVDKITYKVINDSLYEEELQSIVKRNEMPMVLSTMFTGLNYDSLGLYTNEDYAYVHSLDSYEKKVVELRKQIKKRLSIGRKLPDFFLKKSSVNWGRGTFGTEEVSDNRLSVERSSIRFLSENYPEVVYYRSFFCAMNIILLCLMIWLIGKKYRVFDLFYLTLFGVWLVSLISETSSRHIFPYLPLLLVMASCAMPIILGRLVSRYPKWKKSQNTVN